MTAPDPLTPSDLDLRAFDWMPLDVARLRDSDLTVLASGDVFRSAVMLWCAAWHQVPAASLPNNDRLLANLAGYGRDVEAWLVVKDEALRGFIECSDGRLYHPVVAEKAIEAAAQRDKQRKRTEAATSARRNVKRDDQRDDTRNEDHLTLPNPTIPEEKESIPPVAKATRPDRSKFDEFWKDYPKRYGDNPRKPAEKKFNALVKSGVDPDTMIAGAKQASADARARGIFGTKFVPQAIKWLNDHRFTDCTEPPPAEEQVPGYYAKPESEQLAAWDAFNERSTGKRLPRDRNQGWRVKSEWPPGYVPHPTGAYQEAETG